MGMCLPTRRGLVCRYVKVVQVVSCLNARGNTADRLPALWRVGHLATDVT
jgi:hypothetical protein